MLVNKFYDIIAFGSSEPIEIYPGVFDFDLTERRYKGDIIRRTARIDVSSDINPDLSISNNISILPDKYMIENINRVLYVCLHNSKWRVSSYEIKDNRIILTLGGLYNDNKQQN